MPTEPDWHLVDALELDFDGQAKLRLGSKSAVKQWDQRHYPTLALTLKRNRWWIDRTPTLQALQSLSTSKKPPHDQAFFRGVLLKIQADTFEPADKRGVELSLPQTIELFLCEGKGRSGDSHWAQWVNGPTTGTAYSHPHLGTGDQSHTARISEGAAGDLWLRVGRGVLPIAILSRHLLGAETGGSLPERVSTAMLRLSGLLFDLWTLLGSASTRPAQGGESKGGIVGLTTGDEQTVPDWSQRLARLDDLVFRSDVEATWATLVADPFVRLTSRYPTKPVNRTRRPILAGPRGPWSIDAGWSPFNQSGLVRDRQVIRTADTPPNRLAIGLAARVLDELRRIETEAGEKLMESSLFIVADDLRKAAETVLHAPAFVEVPRNARVPLDSPSLQLNARCRPLLDAWLRLDRRMTFFGTMYSEVLCEPIARAEVLYERWCHATMVRATLDAVRESHGPAVHEVLDDAGTLAKVQSSDCQVYMLYTGLLPHRGGDGSESDESWNWSGLNWSTDSAATTVDVPANRDSIHIGISSWSPVSRPDGVIVVAQRDLKPTAHCWDAKYRPLTMPKDEGKKPDRQAAGAAYQAHAFRDAVTIDYSHSESKTSDRLSVSWSLVVHPGAIRPTKRNILTKGRKPLSWDWYRTKGYPGDGGIDIRQAGPAEYTRGTSDPPQVDGTDLRKFMKKIIGP